MTFIKKFLISFLIIIFSVSNASSYSSEEWEKNSINSSNYGSLYYLEIFKNGFGEINVGLFFLFEECEGYNPSPLDIPSIYINNKKIQMMGQCIDEKLRMDFPKTAAGIEYLINELKNKNEITYKLPDKSISFKAKDFLKNYKLFDDINGGL